MGAVSYCVGEIKKRFVNIVLFLPQMTIAIYFLIKLIGYSLLFQLTKDSMPAELLGERKIVSSVVASFHFSSKTCKKSIKMVWNKFSICCHCFTNCCFSICF